ncbi:MAG: hypothetical protein A3K19_27060 [Lentisphaerae bacterium RIFOXYB12_FULL_65_16]|nr:MAG: hypothetical protein A3K18_16630 [Lentisphaerae bacterium RIFOXYA12_64_32]OGV84628.1 MAG: hypothetical protein A3K19_27060 [Lentisphaerae bacterium RIFOXYB12_FULL_65_16]
MNKAKTLTVCVAILGAGSLLLTGCKTATATTPEPAVMCSTCQTVWVRRPHTINQKITTYTTEKSMRCPDCTSAAANFFKTGKFEHTCKACGDNLQACEACK